MFGNTNRLKKLVGFMIFTLTLIIIPQSVKAATPITGGDSKENATEISADIDYVSTDMEGWYKVVLPKDVYAVGAEWDQFTSGSFYKESGEEYPSYYWAKSDLYDQQYSTAYYYSNDYNEGEIFYFTFRTTQADNCYFKVLIGTKSTLQNPLEINLNENISVNKPYDTVCYYKFVAPTTGKYKLTFTAERGSYANITYKDGSRVTDSIYGTSGNVVSAVFDVKQGMTYCVCLCAKEKDKINFSVSNVLVSSIALNATQLSMNRNDQYLLEAVALPENAVDRTVSFSSSNPDVASVSEEGWVTAKSVGSANITVTANDGSGVVATCAVTVNPVAVQKITLAQSSKSFDFWDVYYSDGEYDDELQIYVDTIEPADADNKAVVFASSNPSVAEVDNEGNLTLKSAGTTVITCSAADGFGASATCTVSVTKGLDRGSKFSVGDIRYKVTSYPIDTVKTVSVYGVKNKNASKITIPSTVSTNGETFKVTEIGSKAFYNCKKAKTIQIGKNITKIGKKAFANCKALKKLEVKTTKISSLAKDSLTGINKNAQIKVPASKYKKYQKLFANKGQKSSVKIKKIVG